MEADLNRIDQFDDEDSSNPNKYNDPFYRLVLRMPSWRGGQPRSGALKNGVCFSYFPKVQVNLRWSETVNKFHPII